MTRQMEAETDKDLGAAVNVKLQELEDILEEFERIKSKDDTTDQGVSQQAVSEGGEKYPDIEGSTEVFAGGDKHNCDFTVVDNLETSSELQNVEPGALNSELENTALAGEEYGIVLAVVGGKGSEEFLNPMKGENAADKGNKNEEEHQASDSEEVTHGSTDSKAGDLTDIERNPNASKADQNPASGFQSDATTAETDDRKAADMNTENVGSKLPKPENATLDSKDNGIEMRDDAGEVTLVKVDQEPNLDPQDDSAGDIPERTTERKVVNGTVEKTNTKSVGNQTTTSLILTQSETKGIQTEESAIPEGGMFEGAAGGDSRQGFQNTEGNDSKPTNEIRSQENDNEIEKPTGDECVTQANKLKESTETMSNALPKPTEEGDSTATQCSGSSVNGVQNAVKRSILEKTEDDVRDNTRGSRDNCPEVKIAKEVENLFETQPKTLRTTVTDTAAVERDNHKPVEPFKKRWTQAEIEETLLNLRLGNSCTPSDGRRNATDNIYGKQAGEAEGGSRLPVVKHRAAVQEDKRNEGPSSIARSKLRTLEDCLEVFGLFPLLLKLEESLEEVRRGKKTATEHEADCKSFDKVLVRLSSEHHPDSVMRRGGSEEELTRAKELQTALNAARTVLNTLNKIFLEDIDIEHKYQFFTRLDIGTLGNEDEVENHAYQVLFKISLVSEIKQENIVGEVRRFLEAARLCVDSFRTNDVESFVKHRDSVFFYLKRCVTGYQKLHAELNDVQKECREEKLRNIFPLIQRMKFDCGKQLEHLEVLLQRTQRPFGENFQMYSNAVDGYFVRPIDCYVNVIMACSIMTKKVEDKGGLKKLFSLLKEEVTRPNRDASSVHGVNQIPVVSHASSGGDAISLLCKLASYYAGDKRYRAFVEDLLGKEDVTKDVVKGQFLVRLTEVIGDLREEFKPEDYIVKGTKKFILKELKLCREMKAEFEADKQEVVKGIKEMNKNTKSMTEQLDKMLRDQERVSKELSEQLSKTKMYKEEIGKYSRKKSANKNPHV